MFTFESFRWTCMADMYYPKANTQGILLEHKVIFINKFCPVLSLDIWSYYCPVFVNKSLKFELCKMEFIWLLHLIAEVIHSQFHLYFYTGVTAQLFQGHWRKKIFSWVCLSWNSYSVKIKTQWCSGPSCSRDI